MDYSRQGKWFEPNKFKTPVHIIGAGATGSQIAYQLVKMGVRDLTVYDFDTIEIHNVANQLYGLDDVGMLKVDALKKRLLSDTGIEIKTVNAKVDETFKSQLKGIVFVLTDTMASRKNIFKALRYNPRVELVVETRMSINVGRIYTVNPMDRDVVKMYEETFYGDEEATTSYCGSSLSIIPTAVNISSYAVWSLIKHYLKEEQDNEVIIGLSPVQILTQNW